MAKKKRKKRPPPKPPSEGQPRSARAERKELARKEREAAIRRVKRRRLLRRVGVWALVLAVAGAITAFVLVRRQSQQEVLERADAAAQRFGCGEIQDVPDEGRGHLQPGEAPPQYTSVPAASGRHTPNILDPSVSVYDAPIPEVTTIHNLEHAYVIIYYRAQDDAVSSDTVSALEDLAEDEEKVIIAPYEGLPEGDNLVLVAWNKIQRCAADGAPQDAVQATEGFIQRFRGTANAPEPGAA